MTELQSLYKLLDDYSEFNVSGNPDKFLDSAEKIILINDPNSIPILLSYFDDSREYGWVFETLMISLERYSESEHIQALLKNLETLLKKAPNWASSIFNRILNTERGISLFIQYIHLTSKESLLKLFNLMEVEFPHHQELIKTLKQKMAYST
ncbi:Imm30 family immunity protein [Candidatus Odyssella acanthamoebae]|uniref:Immunity protein 30 domain-containing protein n=1 Tax=Candidatus Odyssella acanthamoebae TaxID=91604 RepID=A0A077AZP7_9PROT|nr:Imm30 family immunity protein [Candidatus Paracaedibacter acanthamoebae]AIK97198.1 hypothetical protein ID47_11350 [Candidatus Paracaedibacter acanthamoebae]